MNILKLFCFIGMLMFTVQSCNKRHEVKKVDIDGVELAYYTRGSGEPLVMIMGFRGTMAMWDPALLDLLAKKFTLILFDNRGAGFSKDSERNLTSIPQMAQDTAKLIKALGYDKVHVLGWSMGSRIAEVLAYNNPELVDKLILCSPNPSGNHEIHRRSEDFEILASTKELSPQEALRLIFPTTTKGQEAAQAYYDRLTKAIVEGSVPNDLMVTPKTVERQIHALKVWDQDNHFYDMLSSLKMPTLVATGLSDTLDPPKNAGIVASRIPFAWNVNFKGAGHAFLSQDYANFAQLVILFVEST
jgi:pimeloyl-ACP methyl ester carboxylesterase